MTPSRRDGGPLRVAIDGRLFDGEYGGVEQVIVGLAHGLSNLEPAAEEYRFLVYEGSTEWLSPHIGGACSVLTLPTPSEPVTWRHRMVSRLPRLAAARRAVLGERSQRGVVVPVPASPLGDGESDIDVMHFTKQDGFVTSVPSIYHPHDLQHVHLPEFFSDVERRRRDLWYRTLCDQARVVTVTSQWGKRDLIANLGLPDAKVEVIPLAPVIQAYGPAPVDVAEVRRRLDLPAEFLLYPAQTWPHKNHLGLIEALRLLNRSGTTVGLVCSGRCNEHYPAIAEAVSAAGLDGQVRFVGFVSPADLRALFAMARGLVMPTLFEAAGGFGPIADAFSVGLPVACSNATSLPEQVGDAALVFDPRDPESVRSAILRVWTDAGLRADLTAKGRARIAPFTWDRVARTFRAHYRRIGGRALDAADQELLRARTPF
jgi:glycosyltransferase involved in cell wall biosynthesis